MPKGNPDSILQQYFGFYDKDRNYFQSQLEVEEVAQAVLESQKEYPYLEMALRGDYTGLGMMSPQEKTMLAIVGLSRLYLSSGASDGDFADLLDEPDPRRRIREFLLQNGSNPIYSLTLDYLRDIGRKSGAGRVLDFVKEIQKEVHQNNLESTLEKTYAVPGEQEILDLQKETGYKPEEMQDQLAYYENRKVIMAKLMFLTQLAGAQVSDGIEIKNFEGNVWDLLHAENPVHFILPKGGNHQDLMDSIFGVGGGITAGLASVDGGSRMLDMNLPAGGLGTRDISGKVITADDRYGKNTIQTVSGENGQPDRMVLSYKSGSHQFIDSSVPTMVGNRITVDLSAMDPGTLIALMDGFDRKFRKAQTENNAVQAQGVPDVQQMAKDLGGPAMGTERFRETYLKGVLGLEDAVSRQIQTEAHEKKWDWDHGKVSLEQVRGENGELYRLKPVPAPGFFRRALQWLFPSFGRACRDYDAYMAGRDSALAVQRQKVKLPDALLRAKEEALPRQSVVSKADPEMEEEVLDAEEEVLDAEKEVLDAEEEVLDAEGEIPDKEEQQKALNGRVAQAPYEERTVTDYHFQSLGEDSGLEAPEEFFIDHFEDGVLEDELELSAVVPFTSTWVRALNQVVAGVLSTLEGSAPGILEGRDPAYEAVLNSCRDMKKMTEKTSEEPTVSKVRSITESWNKVVDAMDSYLTRVDESMNRLPAQGKQLPEGMQARRKLVSDEKGFFAAVELQQANALLRELDEAEENHIKQALAESRGIDPSKITGRVKMDEGTRREVEKLTVREMLKISPDSNKKMMKALAVSAMGSENVTRKVPVQNAPVGQSQVQGEGPGRIMG